MSDASFISDALQQGTLDQLQSLHFQAQRLYEIQAGMERNQDSLEALRQQKDKLLSRHRLLTQSLRKSARIRSLADVLLAQDSLLHGEEHTQQKQPESAPSSPKSAKSKGKGKPGDRSSGSQLSTALKSAKHILFQETLRMHRLSGRTAFPIDKDTVGLRFETFYKGKYHESYYVIFSLLPVVNELIVSKHTVPFFVPMDELTALVNTNFTKFGSLLADYLNAYVTRREQLNEVRDRFAAPALSPISAAGSSTGVVAFTFVDEPVCSPGFDLIKLRLHLRPAGHVLSVSIQYSSLLSANPFDVQMTVTVGDAIHSSLTTKAQAYASTVLSGSLADGIQSALQKI